MLILYLRNAHGFLVTSCVMRNYPSPRRNTTAHELEASPRHHTIVQLRIYNGYCNNATTA